MTDDFRRHPGGCICDECRPLDRRDIHPECPHCGSVRRISGGFMDDGRGYPDTCRECGYAFWGKENERLRAERDKAKRKTRRYK
jgi:hypothetical protein